MVTEQQTSTPMQDWIAQALERMKPILDGSEHMHHARFMDVDEESMADILERVEWLVQHFKVLPEPANHDVEDCECLCWQAGGIAALANVVARMEADEENGA